MFSSSPINFDIAWKNYADALCAYPENHKILQDFFNSIADFIPAETQEKMDRYPLFVDVSPFIWDKQDQLGKTLLMYAVQNKHLDAVNSLLTKTSRVLIKDRYGDNALDHAFQRKEYKIADKLLSVSTEFKTKNFYELLHSSTEKEQQTWLALLKEHKIALDNTGVGFELMQSAIKNQKLNLITFLHSNGISLEEKFFGQYLLDDPLYWTEFFRKLDSLVLSQSIMYIIKKMEMFSLQKKNNFFAQISRFEQPRQDTFWEPFRSGVTQTGSDVLQNIDLPQSKEVEQKEKGRSIFKIFDLQKHKQLTQPLLGVTSYKGPG